MNYLRNGWYCAGFSDDLQEKPRAMTVLEEPIVLYRRSDGRAVALQDRCPHRFAPLSLGKVCGDNIQCAYHGLQFGADGKCKVNPHGDHTIPKAAHVKQYPLVERDTLLWIWMGDPALAHPENVLNLQEFFNSPHHPLVRGHYTIDAHYELVTDNLMDLSHGLFLHGGSLTNGEQEAANFRFNMKQVGDDVIACHGRLGVAPAPFFKKAWGDRPAKVNHRSDMHWSAPSNLRHDVGITEPGQEPEEGIYLHVVHLLTPISDRKTIYHWVAARNFALRDDAASQALHKAINYAFTEEDSPMIAALQQRMGTIDLLSLKPVLLPGDTAGMRARRITEQLRQRECNPNDLATSTTSTSPQQADLAVAR